MKPLTWKATFQTTSIKRLSIKPLVESSGRFKTHQESWNIKSQYFKLGANILFIKFNSNGTEIWNLSKKYLVSNLSDRHGNNGLKWLVWAYLSHFYTCHLLWKLISSNSQNSRLRCLARLKPLVRIRQNFHTRKNFKTRSGWKFWKLSVENESHNEGLRLKYQAKRNLWIRNCYKTWFST